MKPLAASLLLAVLLIAAALAARPGDSAPDFRLADASGKAVTLAQLKGEPAVVTFWATWCTVCRAELPKLHALATERKLRYYVVSPTDAKQAALEYMKRYPAFTPLLAGADSTQAVADRWRVVGQPITFVLDRGGKVVGYHAGVVNLEALKADLAKAGG